MNKHLKVRSDEPVISVVLAVYNSAKTLQHCFDSIAKQTYRNVELIVIDGQSTDGTVDIIKSNESHIFYWESSSDTGIYDAWNKALKHMTGEWVCFLGADDYFWNDKVLEEMAGRLCCASPDFRVVYGQVALVNERDELLYYAGEPWNKVKRKFQHLMILPHQGVMHHRSLFEEHGVFDDNFKIVGDYDFLLRELSVRNALFVPEVIVAGMRQGGVSSKPSQGIRILKEIRASHRKFGYTTESFDWWLAYIKVRVRMLLWQFLGESVTRYLLDIFRVCTGHARHWTKTK